MSREGYPILWIYTQAVNKSLQGAFKEIANVLRRGSRLQSECDREPETNFQSIPVVAASFCPEKWSIMETRDIQRRRFQSSEIAAEDCWGIEIMALPPTLLTATYGFSIMNDFQSCQPIGFGHRWKVPL